MGKDIVDRLTEAAVETNQLLQEVHSATKELRRAIKESQEERKLIESMERRVVDDLLTRHLKQGMHVYNAAMKVAVKEAAEVVTKSFEDLKDKLLSLTRETKDRNKGQSIPEMIDEITTLRHHVDILRDGKD